jgi:site-specific DNA recombinase
LTDGILDQLAKYERAKTAERTRRGKLQRAREGKIVAVRRVRYGLRLNRTRDGYLIDEATMSTVRRIFYMVAQGATLHGVAQTLNREGLQPPEISRSGLWNVAFVRGMIKDDVYRPHSFEELEALVAPEVLAQLDRSSSYGLWWFNRTRTVRRQVAEEGPEGRIYRNRYRTIERSSSDWIGVPVPDSGTPREVVDAARAAIKNNRPSSNSKRRFWELSGGLVWCGGCGRRMHSTSITPGNSRSKRYFYYRCSSQGEGKACPGPKTVPAEKLEADVWQLVSGLLKDPKTLRRDLDTMIEAERATMYEDPEREAKAWTQKLAAADRKRSRYQDMAAEGLITFEELGEKLIVLEDARKAAKLELEALKGKRDRIVELEHDRDALLDSLIQIGAEALDALTPAERNQLYRILRLKVVLRKDRTLEVSGAFGEGLDVCTLESQCRITLR